MLITDEAPLEGQDIVEVGQSEEAVDWLAIVREAYDGSTDYFDANYRAQIERNISNFRSEHPSGSKYHTDAYKARSRIFRPKLRAAQRKAEAAFASAMFSTTDILQIEPVNQDDKAADALCEVWEAVLNHRLKHHVPWYMLAIGAFQKAQVDGICISRQSWEYRDEVEQYEETDNFGNVFQREKRHVKVDRPTIRLIEIENIRLDPAADWTDPLNTSPYVIEIVPMYLNDILSYMESEDEKTGAYNWTRYTKEQIIAANEDLSSNRVAKKSGEQNPDDIDTRIKEFELIYVFRNIIARDGQDWEFYSVGSRLLLSEPTPLQSPVGRGYVGGVTNIEAHRTIPASAMELGQNLQAEANDVANLRLDNVKLALNRRRIVQRGKSTDLGAISRYRPGGVILTDDINSMREEDVREVTSSSYAEQDRINMDIDDIVGGFSTSSVASNRALNQTVGGMQLLNNSSNAQTEYVVRTFVETWVEPVLNQIVRLLQAYENMDVIEMFSAPKQEESPTDPQQQQQPKPKKIDTSDENLLKEVKVEVSVGFGNLDPKMKVQALTQTLTALAGFSPTLVARIDEETLGREVFSAIGYRNGAKFFKPVEEMPQQGDQSAAIEAEKIKLQKEKIEADKQLREMEIKDNHDKWVAELSMQYDLTMKETQARLGLDDNRLNLDILREMGNQQKIKRDREEMMLKQRMGTGI